MTTKTTVATVVALGALAFGAGAALSSDDTRPANAQGDAYGMGQGQGGKGQGGKGQGHSGQGNGQGQGKGQGHGQGNGQGKGKGQGHGQGNGQGKGKGQGHGQGNGQGQGKGQGQGHGGQHGMGAGGATASGTGSTAKLVLTSEAKSELLYMREEEKLAQDVYATLAKQYPDAPFSQITRSEGMHAGAVQRQLDRAGLADPTKGNAVGEFENADLQKLYDTLVKRGASSLTEALKVGALIEETDIADLRASAKTTKDTQLLRVYSNLERASGQHLRIFVGQLKAAGTTYTPTVLSQADVDRILSSTMR